MFGFLTIPSAEETRENAERNRYKYLKKEMKKILPKIRSASKNGEYEVFISLDITCTRDAQDIKDYLIHAGYECSFKYTTLSSLYPHFMLDISWREKEK